MAYVEYRRYLRLIRARLGKPAELARPLAI